MSLKIKVILASIRPNRFGDKPANWITDLAKKLDDVDVELLDLKNFQLPLFAEPISPAHVKGAYTTPDINQWAEKITEADAFIIVTPEYNHGYPASLKNNIDYLHREWKQKPVCFIAYGSTGGARVIEQLRQIAIELQMAPIKNSVHIMNPWLLTEENGDLKTGVLDHYTKAANNMLSQLLWWTKVLKEGRKNP